MAKNKLIVGLDVGSYKTRVVVGVGDEGGALNILGIGISPSQGIRKGTVIDVEETIQNISDAIEDAERVSGEPIYNAFIGIGGRDVASFESRGVIAISHAGNEIIEEDVDRVLDASQAVSLPPNHRVLRVIPKSYSVDEQKNIKHPVGMVGIRLEANTQVLTALAPTVKNIEKCVHKAGVDINDTIPNLIAAPEAVLSRHKKELGCVVIDMGCGCTNVTIFEEGSLLHATAIPVGGESITNDIAICLRTSIDTAEKLKIEYGTCISEAVKEKEKIDLSTISRIDTQEVSKKYLAEVIEARYREIFSLVKAELVKINRDGMLPAGAILCGGAVKLHGTIELAREIIGLPVQVGIPAEIKGMLDKADDPSFATAIGIAAWGMKLESASYGSSFSISDSLSGLKKWFKNLLP